jgi:uncharacterized protein (UPF0335 family)
MSEIGDNSVTAAGISRDQLRSIVERVERLEEEKQAIADDIKEVYAEAKGNGFDTKIIRQVVRIRKQDTAERQEQEALLDVYLAALGMAAAGGGEDEPTSLQDRARRRTTEAMTDNKELSAQMLADGLISEEAHADHVRMSDAVARKYGAGVAGGEGDE